MLLTQDKKEIKKIGVQTEELSFKVDDMNPDILVKIVADMYRNPKRTVMTEYFQNAYDSHKEAGKEDIPVDISLPNSLNPFYCVRDYGVGMTHDQVVNIFRYIFRSTKRNTNDLLGGYGLGKLVFSPYCGVMYLVTYSGTEKTEYLVRLEEGSGGINFISTEDCDEPKGVEIRIPVDKSDWDYFENTARSLYRFLKVKPNVKGIHGFTFDDPEIAIEGDNWAITKSFSNYFDSNPIATIGGLPFEFASGNIDGLSDRQNALLNSSVIMHFNVGELDIVPSRDNLKFSDKTQTAIKQRLNDIIDVSVEKIQTMCSNAETLFDAKDLYAEIFCHRLSGRNPNYQFFSEVIKNAAFTWKGVNIDSFYSTVKKEWNIQNITVLSKHKDNPKVKWYSIDRFMISKRFKYVIFDNNLSEAINKRRVRHWVLGKDIEESGLYIISEGTLDIDLFLQLYRIPEEYIVRVSELEDPPKKARTSWASGSREGQFSKEKVFTLKDNFYNDKMSWVECELDVKNESGIYVEIQYYKPFNGKYFDKQLFNSMVRFILKYNPDIKIIGIKSSGLKRLNTDNWSQIEEYFSNFLLREIKNIKEKINIGLKKFKNIQWLNDFSYDFEELESLQEIFTDVPDVKYVCDFFLKYKKLIKEESEWRKYIKTIWRFLHDGKLPEDLALSLYDAIKDSEDYGRQHFWRNKSYSVSIPKKIKTALEQIDQKYSLLCEGNYRRWKYVPVFIQPEEKSKIEYIKALHFYKKSTKVNV